MLKVTSEVCPVMWPVIFDCWFDLHAARNLPKDKFLKYIDLKNLYKSLCILRYLNNNFLKKVSYWNNFVCPAQKVINVFGQIKDDIKV